MMILKCKTYRRVSIGIKCVFVQLHDILIAPPYFASRSIQESCEYLEQGSFTYPRYTKNTHNPTIPKIKTHILQEWFVVTILESKIFNAKHR